MHVTVRLMVMRKGRVVRHHTFTSENRRLVRIGRQSNIHVPIQDPAVSRCHGLIELRDGEATYIDLGTLSGSFVNGERVQRTPLKSHDQITVGKTDLMVTVSTNEAERTDPSIRALVKQIKQLPPSWVTELQRHLQHMTLNSHPAGKPADLSQMAKLANEPGQGLGPLPPAPPQAAAPSPPPLDAQKPSQDSTQGPARGSEQNSAKPPEQTPAKAPEQASAKPPEQTPAKAPEQASTKAPEQTSAEAPTGGLMREATPILAAKPIQPPAPASAPQPVQPPTPQPILQPTTPSVQQPHQQQVAAPPPPVVTPFPSPQPYPAASPQMSYAAYQAQQHMVAAQLGQAAGTPPVFAPQSQPRPQPEMPAGVPREVYDTRRLLVQLRRERRRYHVGAIAAVVMIAVGISTVALINRTPMAAPLLQTNPAVTAAAQIATSARNATSAQPSKPVVPTDDETYAYRLVEAKRNLAALASSDWCPPGYAGALLKHNPRAETTDQGLAEETIIKFPKGVTYVVAAGDSLALIAKRMLGDIDESDRIFQANRHILRDRSRIHVGMALRIPVSVPTTP